MALYIFFKAACGNKNVPLVLLALTHWLLLVVKFHKVVPFFWTTHKQGQNPVSSTGQAIKRLYQSNSYLKTQFKVTIRGVKTK